MFGGIGALCERSLRLDARSLWTHGLRLGALLIGYWAVVNAAWEARWFGAPGLRFFQYLVTLNGCLVGLAGIGFFSSAITEEKEEGTLGLMQMTGISPLGILFGKLVSRLLQAALLIIIQIPFTLLAITLGGITLPQILATYSTLLALLFLVANVALLASVLAPTIRTASLLMVIFTAGYCFSAMFAEGTYSSLGLAPEFRWVPALWCFRRLGESLSSAAYPSLIAPCEVAHFLGGLLTFGLACWAYHMMPTPSEGGAAPIRLAFKRGPRRLGLVPGRVWPSPIAWKEFFFTLGGWPTLLGKLGAYLGILFLTGAYHYAYRNWGDPWERTVEAGIAFIAFALIIDATTLSSRVFSDELRDQTWSTLMLVPRSLGDLIITKWLAVLFGSLPGLLTWCWLVCFTRPGHDFLYQVGDEPVFWGIVSLVFATMNVAAVYSLFLRWGSSILAGVTIWLGALLFAWLLDSPGMRIDEETAGALMILGTFFITFFSQFAIAARLQHLASR